MLSFAGSGLRRMAVVVDVVWEIYLVTPADVADAWHELSRYLKYMLMTWH